VPLVLFDSVTSTHLKSSAARASIRWFALFFLSSSAGMLCAARSGPRLFSNPHVQAAQAFSPFPPAVRHTRRPMPILFSRCWFSICRKEHQAWCRFLVFAAASDQLPPFWFFTSVHQSSLLFLTGSPHRNQLLSTGLVSAFTVLCLLCASVSFFPLIV
jgi:hypothetical protein